MANANQQVTEPLEAELKEFETCLETPFVPGEHERWMDSVCSAWEQLSPALRERFEREQPEMFEQIVADDPELHERVEELRQHNTRVLELHHGLQQRVSWLQDRVPRVEPDEKKVDDELNRLVDDGLRFVIDVRKQEVALRTWMLEAYERETGPVD